MRYESKKKCLLNLWMLTHSRKLSKAMQFEFMNHPIMERIVQHRYEYAEEAIKVAKLQLLQEILDYVLLKRKTRIQLLSDREIPDTGFPCMACETDFVGSICLCKAA
jgi:hypothetical protein